MKNRTFLSATIVVSLFLAGILAIPQISWTGVTLPKEPCNEDIGTRPVRISVAVPTNVRNKKMGIEMRDSDNLRIETGPTPIRLLQYGRTSTFTMSNKNKCVYRVQTTLVGERESKLWAIPSGQRLDHSIKSCAVKLKLINRKAKFESMDCQIQAIHISGSGNHVSGSGSHVSGSGGHVSGN